MNAATPPGVPPAIPADIDPSATLDFQKSQYSAQLEAWIEEWKENRARENAANALRDARQDTDRATEAALVSAVHAAYIATAQSSLDRALTRMNVVTAAVGTIMTVYTGLLAYVYSADATKGKQLDIVALYPAVFLGLSLFLVTVYAAVFRSKTEAKRFLPTATGRVMVETRLVTFIAWCFNGVLARRWALNAGIVSMGMGIATLPLAFIDIDEQFAHGFFVIGVFLVALTALATAFPPSASEEDTAQTEEQEPSAP